MATNATTKDTTGEPIQQVLEGEPSAVSIEVPTNVAVESSEERKEIASLSFLSSEQTRSVGSEDIPQPKSNEELVQELTLSEAILNQIVAEVSGTVGDTTEI